MKWSSAEVPSDELVAIKELVKGTSEFMARLCRLHWKLLCDENEGKAWYDQIKWKSLQVNPVPALNS